MGIINENTNFYGVRTKHRINVIGVLVSNSDVKMVLIYPCIASNYETYKSDDKYATFPIKLTSGKPRWVSANNNVLRGLA